MSAGSECDGAGDFPAPDYSYIEHYVPTDPKTGNFTWTQQLDMVGYWNIWTINGAVFDRLDAQVTNPANPQQTPPHPVRPIGYRPEWSVIGAAAALLSVGVLGVVLGYRKPTIKISSFRLFFQIGLVMLIFFGVFIDHQLLVVPAADINPHAYPAVTSFFGVQMPDGLPAPFLACWYPCGETVTCALWEIQTYIYPFFNAGGGWGVHYSSTGIERLAVVFAIIILAAVLLGRLFCGWVCPLGLYQDAVTYLRRIFHVKHKSFSGNLTRDYTSSDMLFWLLLLSCA